MRNADSFSSYHPIINFLYFAAVIFFTMFFMHPLCLATSLLCAALYYFYLKGKKALRFCLVFIFPMMLLAAVVNPAFSHAGATLLAYFPNGNPLTLESILYGLAAAAMIAAVVLWFASYTEIMTSDKFVYLFGRLIPALSLVLSMTLRFVPRFKAQFDVVREARQCVGRDISSGSMIRRLGNAVTIFSIMISWSLENAIETADSMKCRAYGLPGRSAFSIYSFDERDRNALAWLLFCIFYVFMAWLSGGLYWRYYPTVKGADITALSLSFQAAYLLLCLTPLLLDLWEDRKWKRLSQEK